MPVYHGLEIHCSRERLAVKDTSNGGNRPGFVIGGYAAAGIIARILALCLFSVEEESCVSLRDTASLSLLFTYDGN